MSHKRHSIENEEDYSDEELAHLVENQQSKLSLDEHENIKGMLNAFSGENEEGFLPQLEAIKPETSIEPKQAPTIKGEIAFWEETENCSIIVAFPPSIYRMKKGQEKLEKMRIPEIGKNKVVVFEDGKEKSKSSTNFAASMIKGTVNATVGVFSGPIISKFIKKQYKFSNVFTEPQGYHTLVTSSDLMESFYIGDKLHKIQHCASLKEMKITAMSWGTPETINDGSADCILIGADTEIYAAEIHITTMKKLISIPIVDAVEELGRKVSVIHTEQKVKESLKHQLRLEKVLYLGEKDRAFDIQLSENFIKQVGAVNIGLTFFYDESLKSLTTMVLQKQSNAYYYSFPSKLKKKALQISDIIDTKRSLPIYPPPPGQGKSQNPSKIYMTEFSYFAVFETGVSICSLITREQLAFIESPFPGKAINWKFVKNGVRVYTKSHKTVYRFTNELDLIENQFMEVNNKKEAYKAAKKHGLGFLSNAARLYSDALFEVEQFMKASEVVLDSRQPLEIILLQWVRECKDLKALYSRDLETMRLI